MSRLVGVLLLTSCGFAVSGSPAPATDGASTADDDAPPAPDDANRDAPPPPIDAPASWVAVETLTVPTTGQQVLSSMALANGVTYRLRASGTFVIQSPQGTLGDAEYWDFTNPISFAGTVDMGIAIDDTTIDGTRTPAWGPYTTTHVYEAPWTGAGQRIRVMLHDGNYANNSGSLTLTILALQ